ncbi:MAG TPA: aminotransferase class V-fold PLP-dependent enzyme [Ruminiclostridium sp.]|jgi:cysteine desulfurase family protein|uniref:cysteine desulfurase n=1 Tax=Acetivibrio saccincola TaxID=1677857 RepID=A0A2S8RCB9_9FIRM|nr:aminotransferase class V-fold PLP-dependent enzyme [Acetivibrio saccincola]NLW26984.1 aminotransferase class V-fold PLP-dependent enzyme [Acetivibrio saccincola]PQQ67425.1 cysteine desulfurase [Acetivibrio saccincola]HAA42583.1 aminotransferase class V-fold PLP-dependent enzyme [Ruminiclostridium sp.]
MIYFDNAATSFPKPKRVYEEMLWCMEKYCANPGRGGHKMSLESGRAVLKVREIISDFFNIKNPMQVVFTKNATEAINIAIKGVLKEGDHVITTCMEHNSVIRPLKALEKENIIELTIVPGDEFGEVDAEDIRRAIKGNTRLIVSTLSSNVNGIIMPVKDIGSIAKEKGVLFLVDAAQGAGSIKIDVEELNIDMLAFPGHKGLLGPQGTGGLYVREGIKINPLILGGTGSNSESFMQPETFPDIFESGTINTPGIVGLGYGIEYINRMGLDNINILKHKLVKTIYEGLSELRNVKIYSRPEISKNSGIIAFNFDDVESNEVSYVLDKVYNVATRSGLHCSPLAHTTLKTIKTGAVRISVGCFNTLEEVKIVLKFLKEISDNII